MDRKGFMDGNLVLVYIRHGQNAARGCGPPDFLCGPWALRIQFPTHIFFDFLRQIIKFLMTILATSWDFHKSAETFSK